MSLATVTLHEADQAARLRRAAVAINRVAAEDGSTIDGLSAAMAAWEQIFGAPFDDDVLRLVFALGELAR